MNLIRTWFYWKDTNDIAQESFVFCPEENIKEATEKELKNYYFKSLPKTEDLKDFYICFFWQGSEKIAFFVEKRKVKKIEGFTKDFFNFYKNPVEYCKLLFIPEWGKFFVDKRNLNEHKITVLFYLSFKYSFPYKYQKGDEFKDYKEILNLKQIENFCF